MRQWPGNAADLDFRGVLEGCTAAIVAAAPVEGRLSQREEVNASILKKMDPKLAEKTDLESEAALGAFESLAASSMASCRASGSSAMDLPQYAKTFRESDEYAAAAKELPFCRLWWVIKPIVTFRR